MKQKWLLCILNRTCDLYDNGCHIQGGNLFSFLLSFKGPKGDEGPAVSWSFFYNEKCIFEAFIQASKQKEKSELPVAFRHYLPGFLVYNINQ